MELAPGDQVVADGALVRADGLLVDESILTGESHPVARESGEDVRSGSFVAEGAGAYVVSAVGPESYAERVAGVARAFRHPRSPLQNALDRLLWALVALMVPLAVVLGVSLTLRDRSAEDNVQTAVAAIVSLIPEGLILLASLTYAVAALRMARRGALAQELNAVESLASVDVLCTDKTGTLTSADLRVVALVPAGTSPRTSSARRSPVTRPPLPRPTARWPRSPPPSRRRPRRRGRRCRSPRGGAGARWSSATGVGARRAGVPAARPPTARARGRRGRARAPGGRLRARHRPGVRLGGRRAAPADRARVAVLSERLRADARETIAYLREGGRRGQGPLGERAGHGRGHRRRRRAAPGAALDGRALPADPAELAEAVSGAADRPGSPRRTSGASCRR